jgi:hypothetical protein
MPQAQPAMSEIARDSTHEPSARALFSLATLRLGQRDLVTAHRLAQRGLAHFPGSASGQGCAGLIEQIEAKSLSLSVSEDVWNTPAPTIEVNYRNFDRIYFRLVAFDYESALTYRRNSGDYDTEVYALLWRSPWRQWSVPLRGTPDYRERTERLPVPSGLPAGSYHLLWSTSPDYAGAQHSSGVVDVWISDLALVLRDGRPGGLEGFVLTASGGAPVEGAEIRTWLREGFSDDYKPGPTVRTDRNGLFRLAGTAGTSQTAALLVTHGGRRLGGSCSLSDFPSVQPQPLERTLFFTDRAIYRPGQTIQYKGLCIALDPERDDYRTLLSRSVTVALTDPTGREVATSGHTTNGYGSFSGTFVAPEGGLRGAMQLRASTGPAGATGVHIE